MRRLALLGAATCCLAGCGGSKHAAPTATAPPPAAAVLGAGAHTLYQGTSWAVVRRGTIAVAAHLVGGRWVADRSGRVAIDVLGPKPGSVAAATPQVAAEFRGGSRFVETALWVDGTELLEKGGGLSPKHVTIYGAPATPLRPGRHVAVAYGRDAANGTAVAWSFTVG